MVYLESSTEVEKLRMGTNCCGLTGLFLHVKDFVFFGIHEGFAEVVENFERCDAIFARCYGCEDPSSRFVGSQFKEDDRSSLIVDFTAETPGDVLGVNIHDPALTREELKKVANHVFRNAHSDRFNPDSNFAKQHDIQTHEQANLYFTIYRKSYEEFCKEKGWLL